MPETAVNQDHLTSRRKYEIGLARQSFIVQSIAVAKPVHKTPHGQFRLCGFAANPPHVFASLLRLEVIHLLKFLLKPLVHGQLLILSGPSNLRQKPNLTRLFDCDILSALIAR